jgi:signal transduction histidine kinase
MDVAREGTGLRGGRFDGLHAETEAALDVGAIAARGRRNPGLPFIRERAESFGGRVEVRSHPGGGTVVRLAIPLREESR